MLQKFRIAIPFLVISALIFEYLITRIFVDVNRVFHKYGDFEEWFLTITGVLLLFADYRIFNLFRKWCVAKVSHWVKLAFRAFLEL
jgi:hypothetical protein